MTDHGGGGGGGGGGVLKPSLSRLQSHISDRRQTEHHNHLLVYILATVRHHPMGRRIRMLFIKPRQGFIAMLLCLCVCVCVGGGGVCLTVCLSVC